MHLSNMTTIITPALHVSPPLQAPWISQAKGDSPLSDNI